MQNPATKKIKKDNESTNSTFNSILKNNFPKFVIKITEKNFYVFRKLQYKVVMCNSNNT